MKILHTADWHIGAYAGPATDDTYRRTENTRKCLDALLDTARREQPDIILVCGDIFHTARCWNDRGMQEFRIAIDYLAGLGRIAPVCVLFGTPNHDNIETFRAMDEYFTGKYSLIRFFYDNPEMITTDTKAGPIQIAGLPGFDKGKFREKFPGLSAEDENKIFGQELGKIILGMSAQINPSIPSVLIAHYTVAGSEMDNGTSVFVQNEIVINPADIDASNFDLVCLGHIHKAQAVSVCDKPVYYSGSLDAFTFNDEDHDKGYYIHCIGKGTTHYFMRTPSRKFSTFRWGPEEISLYNNSSQKPFSTISLDGLVTRVLYTCDQATEKALDKKKVERYLYDAGAFYVSEIRPEKIEASVNRERMHEKMTVKNCLTKYLQEKGKTSEEIKELTQLAEEIIQEVGEINPNAGQSGLFLPLEIKVTNYRSYKEETFNFRDIYFAMVNGKNGCGKSSLFMDAITDCLYEEPREGDLTGWIKNGEKSGSISFTFWLGYDEWRVTRTRMKSGKTTLSLHRIYLDDDGLNSTEDHSCQKVTDTQQEIINLLGMDCQTFQSCVLIMQDRYGLFMNADKESRMSVLSNLLGLSVYDELTETTKKRLTDINRDLRTVKDEIDALSVIVDAGEKLEEEKTHTEGLVAGYKNAIDATKKIVDDAADKLSKMEQYKDESARLKADYSAKEGIRHFKTTQKDKLYEDIAKTRNFLAGEDFILRECNRLEELRLKLAELEGRDKLRSEKHVQLSKLMKEKDALQSQINLIEQKTVIISGKLSCKEKYEITVESLKNTPQQLQDLVTARSAHDALTSRKAILESKIEGLRNQMFTLGVAECIDIENAKCKFLQQAKQAKIDVVPLEEDLKMVTDEITKLGYDPYLLKIIEVDAKTYGDAKAMLSSMAADEAVLKELRSQLTELNNKVPVMKEEILSLQDELTILTAETTDVPALKLEIEKLTPILEKKEKIPAGKQFLEITVPQAEALEVEIENLQQQIDDILARQVELSALTVGAEELEKKKAEGEQHIKMAEIEMGQLNRLIGAVEEKLKSIAQSKLRIDVQKNHLKVLACKAAHLQILVDAFCQDGIPFQIIRDIIPELEASANEILSQMTAGRMNLSFITEKVLKSNKNKEVITLEIQTNDLQHGVLPYLSRSGGQKVRAALAVNFALANIKASRVGLQLGMMFIDEPPYLDSDGAEAYCTALQVIHSKYPDMRILAISHDENMKSMFPQQITIELTSDGSRVVR